MDDETEYLNVGKDQIEAKFHSTLSPLDVNAIGEAKFYSTVLQTRKNGNAFDSAALSNSSIADDDAHRIQSRSTKVAMTVSKEAITNGVSAMITVADDDIQEYDVLSGRGGKSNNHQGNKFYRRLVELKKEEYKLRKKKNFK
jgi:hypothetical protein